MTCNNFPQIGENLTKFQQCFSQESFFLIVVSKWISFHPKQVIFVFFCRKNSPHLSHRGSGHLREGDQSWKNSQGNLIGNRNNGPFGPSESTHDYIIVGIGLVGWIPIGSLYLWKGIVDSPALAEEILTPQKKHIKTEPFFNLPPAKTSTWQPLTAWWFVPGTPYCWWNIHPRNNVTGMYKTRYKTGILPDQLVQKSFHQPYASFLRCCLVVVSVIFSDLAVFHDINTDRWYTWRWFFKDTSWSNLSEKYPSSPVDELWYITTKKWSTTYMSEKLYLINVFSGATPSRPPFDVQHETPKKPEKLVQANIQWI